VLVSVSFKSIVAKPVNGQAPMASSGPYGETAFRLPGRDGDRNRRQLRSAIRIRLSPISLARRERPGIASGVSTVSESWPRPSVAYTTGRQVITASLKPVLEVGFAVLVEVSYVPRIPDGTNIMIDPPQWTRSEASQRPQATDRLALAPSNAAPPWHLILC